MRDVSLEAGSALLAGAVSVEAVEGGLMPWRIPYWDRELFEPELVGRAAWPAGVRVRLWTDTSAVEVALGLGEGHEQSAVGQVDLVVDDELRERQAVSHESEASLRFEGLGGGMKRVEVYLPQSVRTVVRGLRVDEGAAVHVGPSGRPRWIAYGSSITQCSGAAGPSETWPAIVARRKGLDLMCLGYGGNCHMEPMVGRMIRDLEAACLSVCLGINVYGSGSLNERTFRAAVLGLVGLIREGHGGKPLVVMSPIYSGPRETTPNVVGLTLEMMRERIAEAVSLLRGRGDERLHYVDGLRVFGADLAGHLPDELHPDAAGYRKQAEGYLREAGGVISDF